MAGESEIMMNFRWDLALTGYHSGASSPGALVVRRTLCTHSSPKCVHKRMTELGGRTVISMSSYNSSAQLGAAALKEVGSCAGLFQHASYVLLKTVAQLCGG
jgi:hypothetical protein